MAKIQMISIGPKFVGQTKMWTLMNKNREMINIPYRPFLDVVFPKGKAVPIIYEKTEKGRMAKILLGMCHHVDYQHVYGQNLLILRFPSER